LGVAVRAAREERASVERLEACMAHGVEAESLLSQCRSSEQGKEQVLAPLLDQDNRAIYEEILIKWSAVFAHKSSSTVATGPYSRVLTAADMPTSLTNIRGKELEECSFLGTDVTILCDHLNISGNQGHCSSSISQDEFYNAIVDLHSLNEAERRFVSSYCPTTQAFS
jgi:hypothetical protein